ncbi:hypothetical protein BaRGS_00026335 [Batillaria attramentaria]|uniref:Uncharacterized protein n=1 Tax=Batillaria attramentaria TaxID=370345 RepID=A0ABD0K6A5_9CAEN
MPRKIDRARAFPFPWCLRKQPMDYGNSRWSPIIMFVSFRVSSGRIVFSAAEMLYLSSIMWEQLLRPSCRGKFISCFPCNLSPLGGANSCDLRVSLPQSDPPMTLRKLPPAGVFVCRAAATSISKLSGKLAGDLCK